MSTKSIEIYILITWPHITILSLAPSVEKRRTLSPACNKKFREPVKYVDWSEKGVGWVYRNILPCKMSFVSGW